MKKKILTSTSSFGSSDPKAIKILNHSGFEVVNNQYGRKLSEKSIYDTYDYARFLNYNMNPIKNNKGSAIFIHISKRNYKSTEGCVAIKKLELLKLLKEVKKNTKVKII